MHRMSTPAALVQQQATDRLHDRHAATHSDRETTQQHQQQQQQQPTTTTSA